MEHPEVIDLINGFVTLVMNVIVMVVIVKLGRDKRTSIIFLYMMCISASGFGLCLLARGIVMLIGNVTTVAPCCVMMTIGVTCWGTYMSSLLFVYLELYMSIKNVSNVPSVFSPRTSRILTLVSVCASPSTLLVGIAFVSPEVDLTSYRNCVFGKLYQASYRVTIELLFIGMLAAVIVVHALAICEIRKSYDRIRPTASDSSDGAPVSSGQVVTLAYLKNRQLTLKIMQIILCIYSISWGVVMGLHLAEFIFKKWLTNKAFSDFSYAFSQIAICLPYTINGVVIMVKNDKFRVLWKKYLDRLRRSAPCQHEIPMTVVS